MHRTVLCDAYLNRRMVLEWHSYFKACCHSFESVQEKIHEKVFTTTKRQENNYKWEMIKKIHTKRSSTNCQRVSKPRLELVMNLTM